MTQEAVTSPQKSTIDRLFAIERRPLAWLSRVAPGLAARVALRLFATPRRGGRGARLTPNLPPGRWERLKVHGERLALVSWGTGPTVLLVHGWNADHRSLGAFVAPLLAAGYRVRALELPAHGRSTGRRATLLEASRAVEAVARRLGPLHAVIAHSLGATATALALGRGVAAERAVLLAPPAELPPFARRFAGWLGLDATATERFLRGLERRVGAPLEHFDLRSALPGLRVPGLVVHDRGDREVPFAHGEAVAAAWPGAGLLPLSGLGHTRLLADSRVVQAVCAFLTVAGSGLRRSA